jgi:uncharacterized protein (TIGR03437 family)
MLAVPFRIRGVILACASTLSCWGATFGTVVPIQGTVSDISLDERRGVVWAANFSAYRVEMVVIASQTLGKPLTVPMPPSAVAISPNHRFLVVGEYQKPDPAELSLNPFAKESGGYTIFDLDADVRYDVNLGSPVLSVAFGRDNNAVILTRTPVPADPNNPGPLSNLFLLQPFPFQTLTAITSIPVQSVDLPTPLVKFPTQIGQATAGVSGDRFTLAFLAAVDNDPPTTSRNSVLIRYDVATQTAFGSVFKQSPPAGPRSVSVDDSADNILTDWALLHYPVAAPLYLRAQFPRANGAFNIGSHAWDLKRNLIYAQIPTPEDKSVLHVVDTDNLTVRERIQMVEDLSGKSQMSTDNSVMYSASVSGVTILPIAQLPNTQQVGATQEDLLFAADACNRLVLKQTVNIVSLSSVETDFTLSLPTGTTGVTLSAKSGTTPAQVIVTIDPTVFQASKGTSSISLTIASTGSVNLPFPVRLLINTRDFNQRGQIVNIPGKLVDMLADPARNRVYLLRQDKNLVLVYDMTTMQQVFPSLRTGNTPIQMSMTLDQRYLMVGNDNSQIASVFDLDDLPALLEPLVFPFGHYPRSIGVARTGIFGFSRLPGNVGEEPPFCDPRNDGLALLDHVIDFAKRIVDTPCTLSAGPSRSIYRNGLPTADGVLAASPSNDHLLLSLSDGNVLEYADSAQTWVASRKDFAGLGGAYGVFNAGLLSLVGPNILDPALVPTGTPFPATDGASSGVAALIDGSALRTTTPAANGPGVIQRINLNNFVEYSATPMAEAPVTSASLLTPPVGQIGETILSFTRSLAISPDQTRIFALTISGLTILNSNFDAALAKPVISSLTNAADQSPLVALGGVVDINGSSLASGPVSAGAPPLPSSLGEVCAIVNNIALPLFSVSPAQLVAQLPNFAGPASLVVHTTGGISDPFAFTIQAQAPAIFQTGGVLQVIRDDNGQPVDFTNPIHPSSDLTMFVTGLGLTNPLPALGTAAPAGTLAVVTNPPAVSLGGVALTVTSATLVSGQIGVYQIKITVPAKVQPSQSTPLTVSAGNQSATYFVRVVSP